MGPILRYSDIERILVLVGAVESTDQRLRRRVEDGGGETKSQINSRNKNTKVDDDDDWD